MAINNFPLQEKGKSIAPSNTSEIRKHVDGNKHVRTEVEARWTVNFKPMISFHSVHCRSNVCPREESAKRGCKKRTTLNKEKRKKKGKREEDATICGQDGKKGKKKRREGDGEKRRKINNCKPF